MSTASCPAPPYREMCASPGGPVLPASTVGRKLLSWIGLLRVIFRHPLPEFSRDGNPATGALLYNKAAGSFRFIDLGIIRPGRQPRHCSGLLPQEGDLLPTDAGASGCCLPGVHSERHLVRQLARRDQLLLRLARACPGYRPVFRVGSLDPNRIRVQQCSPHLRNLHGGTHCRLVCLTPVRLSRIARRRAYSNLRWTRCLLHRIHRSARLALCGNCPRPPSPTSLGGLGRRLMPDRTALFPTHLLGRTGHRHRSSTARSAASPNSQRYRGLRHGGSRRSPAGTVFLRPLAKLRLQPNGFGVQRRQCRSSGRSAGWSGPSPAIADPGHRRGHLLLHLANQKLEIRVGHGTQRAAFMSGSSMASPA